MATVLDFSILSSLSIIFIFIAVFVTGWGITYYINPFKLNDDAKKVYAVLAFALSFIIILSKPALGIISFSMPWFSIIMMVGFFMLFFSKMFNPDLDTAGLISRASVWGFLVFFVGIVLLFAFANTIGQGLLEQQPGVTTADRINGDTSAVDTFVPVEDVGNNIVVDSNGQTVALPEDQEIGSNIVLTLFHPNILGMMFMMLLGTITILLIAR